jgi:hypothetical protein
MEAACPGFRKGPIQPGAEFRLGMKQPEEGLTTATAPEAMPVGWYPKEAFRQEELQRESMAAASRRRADSTTASRMALPSVSMEQSRRLVEGKRPHRPKKAVRQSCLGLLEGSLPPLHSHPE